VALDKDLFFVQCRLADTRQSELLCRVSPGTLGKDFVSVTRRHNGCFSLPSAPWHSANRFAKCPRQSTRQRRLCRCTVCRALFAECDTRQSVCRVFLRLCRVLQALSKACDSGSACTFLEVPRRSYPIFYAWANQVLVDLRNSLIQVIQHCQIQES
jgi:hypothetical protein